MKSFRWRNPEALGFTPSAGFRIIGLVAERDLFLLGQNIPETTRAKLVPKLMRKMPGTSLVPIAAFVSEAVANDAFRSISTCLSVDKLPPIKADSWWLVLILLNADETTFQILSSAKIGGQS